jgi:type II secretory ATPase GspE/PulE/Tfp pilus assembly ATPase PilB-like protein
MGVPSYLLASALLVLAAQRLVRRICEKCPEPYQPDEEELAVLGIGREQLAQSTLRRGRGCPHCVGTGYHGRMAVYEVLRVTPQIRDQIRLRASSEEIHAAARAAGMRSLFEAGVARALRGETTLSEVRRVLFQGD